MPKTKIIPRPQDIPEELQLLKIWVLWKMEPRPDGLKPTKVPYQIGGKYGASSTNPEHWVDFRTALEALKRSKTATGIGLMVHNTGLTVIDLDHCWDDETQDFEPWALDIVKRFNCYSEISPSSQGIHLVMKATLPPNGCRKGQIEMYDTARFLTITGCRLPDTPCDVPYRTPELEKFHAETFGVCRAPEGKPTLHCITVESLTPEQRQTLLPIWEKDAELYPPSSFYGTRANPLDYDTWSRDMNDRAIKGWLAREDPGTEFSRKKLTDLLEGRWQDYKNSQSEADESLCSILAWWNGCDIEDIDRRFRASKLYREKWERASYRDPTLRNAIEFVKKREVESAARGWVEIDNEEALKEVRKTFHFDPEGIL